MPFEPNYLHHHWNWTLCIPSCSHIWSRNWNICMTNLVGCSTSHSVAILFWKWLRGTNQRLTHVGPRVIEIFSVTNDVREWNGRVVRLRRMISKVVNVFRSPLWRVIHSSNHDKAHFSPLACSIASECSWPTVFFFVYDWKDVVDGTTLKHVDWRTLKRLLTSENEIQNWTDQCLVFFESVWNFETGPFSKSQRKFGLVYSRLAPLRSFCCLIEIYWPKWLVCFGTTGADMKFPWVMALSWKRIEMVYSWALGVFF